MRGPFQHHAPRRGLALYALTAVAIVLAVIWNDRRKRAALDRTVERRLLELAHIPHGNGEGA